MNTTVTPRDLFRSLCIALAVMLALTALARAQEKPAPADPSSAASAPAPAASPAEERPATPAAASPAPSATDEKSGLRRLDEAPPAKTDAAALPANDPAAGKDSAGPKSDETDKDAKVTRTVHEWSTEKGAGPANEVILKAATEHWSAHGRSNEMVSVGHDSHLLKGETADAVVSVFGSSTADGDVSGEVVSVLGDTHVNGVVDGESVAVLGNNYVNSHVKGQVVAVGGNVELGPEAEVDGDVVAVGGAVKRDPQAVIHGLTNNVSIGGVFSNLEWLKVWLFRCAFRGRLLAFGPELAWAWWVALGFLGFYVLLALLFRNGVEKCTQTLESRPGYSILTALLSTLIAPIAILLLAITGVGLVVVPFVAAGIFFAALFGKAVMLAWLGRRFTRFAGLGHPALAVLVGGLIVLGFYLVPILGIIIYKLLGWIGMGVVVYTLILGMKREKPPVVPPSPAGSGAAPAPVAAVAAGPLSGDQSMPVPPVTVAAPPVMPAALLARAGFWHRMAALALDVIVVGIVCSFFSGIFPHNSPVRIRADLLPVLATYGAVMWKLKGTTIGGIICGLKVVRLDDRPIDWGTAIVRALGCFLSLAVIFLGFIWVAFDGGKQAWHDKIAGTVVVKAPKGTPLV